MRIRNVFLLFFVLFMISNIYVEENSIVNTEGVSPYSVSFSPLSLLTLMIGDNVDNITARDIWFSLSINTRKNSKEYDWFLAKYPQVFSIGLETRIFSNNKLQGFFYGPFVSLDVSRLALSDNKTPQYSTDQYTDGDIYYCIGPKIGGAFGYRIKIKEIGVTPKIGMGIPIIYLSDLNPYNKDELINIYLKNMLFTSMFIGLKIDISQ